LQGFRGLGRDNGAHLFVFGLEYAFVKVLVCNAAMVKSVEIWFVLQNLTRDFF
jgi:hypothetical protein